MFDKHTVEIDWGGRPLTLESGKVARQADGSVIATLTTPNHIHSTYLACSQPTP